MPRKTMIAFLGLLLCSSAFAKIKPGDMPPNALGHTADGQVVTVSSLRGKVVVVSFWARWCKYCMKEMPVMAGLQTVAAERHIPLQVVYVNSEESHRVFERVGKALQQRMPKLLITWDEYGSIGRPFGANDALPVMVMLHRDGTVAAIHTGYDESNLDNLIAQINSLLSEPAPVAVNSGAQTSAAR